MTQENLNSKTDEEVLELLESLPKEQYERVFKLFHNRKQEDCNHTKWSPHCYWRCPECGLIENGEDFFQKHNSDRLSVEERTIRLLNAFAEANVQVENIDWGNQEKPTIITLTDYPRCSITIVPDKIDLLLKTPYDVGDYSLQQFGFSYTNINPERDIHGSLLYVLSLRNRQRR